jgi:hypothetical protein
LKFQESEEEMLPKLIAFYESLGGIYYKDLDLMLINLDKGPEHNWETKFRDRATILANHVTQSAQANAITNAKAMGRINVILNHLQK